MSKKLKLLLSATATCLVLTSCGTRTANLGAQPTAGEGNEASCPSGSCTTVTESSPSIIENMEIDSTLLSHWSTTRSFRASDNCFQGSSGFPMGKV